MRLLIGKARHRAAVLAGAAIALALAACAPAAPTVAQAAPEAVLVCTRGVAYQPADTAEAWLAAAADSIAVTGDVYFAPQLLAFQRYAPAGLEYLGARPAPALAALAEVADCVALYRLIVDPAPREAGRGLCEGQSAGFVAAAVDAGRERLILTIYAGGEDPLATPAAEPCRVLAFER